MMPGSHKGWGTGTTFSHYYNRSRQRRLRPPQTHKSNGTPFNANKNDVPPPDRPIIPENLFPENVETLPQMEARRDRRRSGAVMEGHAFALSDYVLFMSPWAKPGQSCRPIRAARGPGPLIAAPGIPDIRPRAGSTSAWKPTPGPPRSLGRTYTSATTHNDIEETDGAASILRTGQPWPGSRNGRVKIVPVPRHQRSNPDYKGKNRGDRGQPCLPSP